MRDELQHIVDELPQIGLKDLEQLALNKRCDTKYIVPSLMAGELISGLSPYLKVLEVNNQRLVKYKNQYFDTPNRKFYRDHHSGKLSRIKIRARSYGPQGPFFLEQKKRTNKRIVEKLRVEQNTFEAPDFDKLMACSAENLHSFELGKSLEVNYTRISFVHKDFTKKLTLDFDLSFRLNGHQTGLPGIAIAEIKEPLHTHRSVFVEAMKKFRLYPTGISKYCVGISLLVPGARSNNFKPLLRKLKKIQKSQVHGHALVA